MQGRKAGTNQNADSIDKADSHSADRGSFDNEKLQRNAGCYCLIICCSSEIIVFCRIQCLFNLRECNCSLAYIKNYLEK